MQWQWLAWAILGVCATEPWSTWPLTGHAASVTSAAFSPDCTTIVTSSSDGTARLWDASTAALRTTLRGHTAGVRNAVFSADGMFVATGSNDHTARVWAATNGTLLHVLQGHNDEVAMAQFSPDGTRIVTASMDFTARVWDTSTGAPLHILKEHGSYLSSAYFSTDGAAIVSASYDNTACVWDGRTGALTAVLQGHSAALESAQFSTDGSRVATASHDNTARVWNTSSGALQLTLDHPCVVRAAQFSPDGTRVVTACDDGKARLWDAVRGTLNMTLMGHIGLVFTAQFSADGYRVLTAGADKTARIWDVRTGALLEVLRGHSAPVKSAQFSPNGTNIVTGSEDNTAREWESLSSGLLIGHQGNVRCAQYSPDGSLLVSAGDEFDVIVWSTTSLAQLRVLSGHQSNIWSAQFSPDGSRIVTASSDKTARVWSAEAGSQLFALQHTRYVRFAQFSPDGTKIATCGDDNSARLWDAGIGTLLSTLLGHTGRVLSVQFSPDSQWVVSASDDHTARVWNTNSGTLLCVLTGHESFLVSAIFSPDGTQIVTASYDNTSRIWNASNGELLFVLSGHTDYVRSAQFSPDGTLVVTASNDFTTRLWSTNTGSLRFALLGHTDVVNTAQFSTDNARVVTASWDTTARVWDSATGYLLGTFQATDALNTAQFSPDGVTIAAAGIDFTVTVTRSTILSDPVGCTRTGFRQLLCASNTVLSFTGSRWINPVFIGNPADPAPPACVGDTLAGCFITAFPAADPAAIWQLPFSPLPLFSFLPAVATLSAALGGESSALCRAEVLTQARIVLPNCEPSCQVPLSQDPVTVVVHTPSEMEVTEWQSFGFSEFQYLCAGSVCTILPGLRNSMTPTAVRLTAIIAPIPGTVSILLDGTGSGVVEAWGLNSSGPSMRCVGSVACTIRRSGPLFLRALADPGSAFVRWRSATSQDIPGCSKLPECEVAQSPLDLSLHATFALAHLVLVPASPPDLSPSVPATVPLLAQLRLSNDTIVGLLTEIPLVLTVEAWSVENEEPSHILNVTVIMDKTGNARFPSIALSAPFKRRFRLVVRDPRELLDSVQTGEFTMGPCNSTEFAPLTGALPCRPCDGSYRCQDCRSPGLLCDGSSARTLAAGNWWCHVGALPLEPVVYACLGPCRTNGSDNPAECLDGTNGPLCAACSPGFSFLTAGKCARCWPASAGVPFVIGCAVAVFAAFVWFVRSVTTPAPALSRSDYSPWTTKPSNESAPFVAFPLLSSSSEALPEKEKEYEQSPRPSVVPVLKQLINFLQVVAQCRSLRAEIGSALRWLITGADLVNSGVFALGLPACYVNLTPKLLLLVITLGQPALCVIVGCCATATARCMKGRKRDVQLTLQIISGTIMAGLLTSPFATSRGLAVFPCEEFAGCAVTSTTSLPLGVDSGKWRVLRQDYSTSCQPSEELHQLHVLGMAVVGAHGFVFPLLGAACVVYFYRRHGLAITAATFPFCTQGYRSGQLWWEWVQLLRKLTVAIVLTFVPQPTAQAIAVVFVLLISLLAFLQARPFADLQTEQREWQVSGCLMAALILIASQPLVDAGFSSALRGCTLFSLLVAILLFCWALVRASAPLCKR